MMKPLTLIFLLHLSTLAIKCYSQQVPHFTQYLLNDYLFNPGIAGSREAFEVKTNGRYQWVGFPGAPQTWVVSASGPYRTEHVGVGGVVFTDKTGPTSRNGFSGSYAFHLRVAEELRLSMSLALGMVQYRINAAEFQYADPDEPGAPQGKESAMVPDGTFGLYAYHPSWFFGISSYHIFHNPLKDRYFAPTSSIYGYLVNHMFIIGGYTYEVNSEYSLQPSFLLKGVSPVPAQLEINLRGIYKDQYWVGLGFRTQDSFSALAGVDITDRLSFGYSFDFTYTGLRKFNSGSHEMMISYEFDPPQKCPKANTEEPMME